MIFESGQMKKRVVRTGVAGARLFLAHQRRTADPANRSALHLLLLLITGFVAFAPRTVLAHPMGNFSISHFAGLRIEADAVDIRYILDLAEIPTFQEIQAASIVPAPDDPRVIAYLASKAEALKGGLAVTLNGRPLALAAVSVKVIFPPGAGNLPTMKIGVVYRASLAGVECPCTLAYRDGNFAGRAGWKEVVASAGPGAALVVSTVAAISRSQELASYPTDLINSPPQDLSAQLTFALTKGLAAEGNSSALPRSSLDGLANPEPSRRANAVDSRATPASVPSRLEKTPMAVHALPPKGAGRKFVSAPPSDGGSIFVSPPAISASAMGAPIAMPPGASMETLALEANKQGTPRNSFTELITSNRWGLGFMLTAALIAAALGGLHGLEPGHGKTIVAAYLVGSQGTAAHALVLGLIVTATHTAGVYALGLLTLYASKYMVPDHLYPWLGIASGLTIAFLGLYMLRRRWAGHRHTHGHHHHLDPGSHSHDHGHSHGHGHTHEYALPGHAHHHPHFLEHQPDHAHDSGHSPSPFSYRQLVTLGVTGGIVPCPAALVVLLSAISLHRVAFGLYLIVAFSLGLAAVLISIGMVTVYARRLLARLPSDGPLINRWLPTASAAAITCLGAGIAVQAVLATGVLHIQF
jgi:nickel/cobalt transporter (NicO) family protein